MNIMPPLCVTPGEVEQIVSTMDGVIGQVASEPGRVVAAGAVAGG